MKSKSKVRLSLLHANAMRETLAHFMFKQSRIRVWGSWLVVDSPQSRSSSNWLQLAGTEGQLPTTVEMQGDHIFAVALPLSIAGGGAEIAPPSQSNEFPGGTNDFMHLCRPSLESHT